MLDTTSLPKKNVEQAFGFEQGERWFGFVVCDEQEDTKRIRSGIFEGELVLISKRKLPPRKVRVNSESQEITLLDVNRDGSDMPITIPYTVRVIVQRDGEEGGVGACARVANTWAGDAAQFHHEVIEPLHLLQNRVTGDVVGCSESHGVEGTDES